MAEREIMVYAFELSQEIKVEKRQVTSIPGLFGDLGGLYEFLATIVATLVSGYQVRAYSFDLIKSFFRVAGLKRQSNLTENQSMPLQLPMRQKLFQMTKFSMWLRLKLTYWSICFCCASTKEKKVRKIIQAGENKIERAFNVRTLIHLERTFSTILRLSYSKSARKLLQLQRRQTVLEANKPRKFECSSSEDDIDSDDHQRKTLQKLQYQSQFFQSKEQRLAKGIFQRNGCDIEELNSNA